MDNAHELIRLRGGPVFGTYEDHIDAAAVARKDTGGVEKFLEDLVVSGKADLAGKAQFAHPEGQAGLYGFGGEGGADRDVQIPLYGYPYGLMPCPGSVPYKRFAG